jgi:hypothetical protein
MKQCSFRWAEFPLYMTPYKRVASDSCWLCSRYSKRNLTPNTKTRPSFLLQGFIYWDIRKPLLAEFPYCFYFMIAIMLVQTPLLEYLMCVRCCAKCFTSLHLIPPVILCQILTPTSQRKPRLGLSSLPQIWQWPCPAQLLNKSSS